MTNNLRLYNTLSRKVEEFKPIKPPRVGMYTCGPTVYDYMHIGNLRTFILADILYRVLKINGYDVKHVQNITDIDDKIIVRAKERNISIKELAEEFTKYFLEDIKKLNILSPNIQPKATEHVEKMVKFIEELIKKELAYLEKDGSVYFDISKFPNYGKLSALQGETLRTGTRILSDNYEKDNAQDFALWKAVSTDEVGWDSPWARGRPGWHIECSVMSEEYLGGGEQGRTIDIHAGGVDLMFPHHENEIAQSEGKSGKPFVKYFVHGEHLLVDGQKMSKSLNNFFRLKDLEDKGFDPLALRYLFLTAHYRDKINFTWESLQAAQNALNNLRDLIREWSSYAKALEDKDDDYYQKFMEAVNNDLNMPQAIAVLWEMVKSDESPENKAASILKMDQILGLGLEDYLGKPLEIPEEVMELVEKRENARKSGDFDASDEIRKQIKKMGFEIEDTPNGPKLK